MRRRSWMAGLALAGAGLAVAVTSAFDSNSGQIYACVNNGATKIVPAGTTCPNGQTLISWNIQGPAGAPGPSGTQGPAGPTGPQGPSVSAYSNLGDQTFMRPNDPPVLMSVYCNAGDAVTGGGFWNWDAGPGGDRNDVVLSESTATGLWTYPFPTEENKPVGGWEVRAQNKGNAILILSATVHCLHLGS